MRFTGVVSCAGTVVEPSCRRPACKGAGAFLRRTRIESNAFGAYDQCTGCNATAWTFPMDLRRWAHIVAVADRRSFVRAAEAVHLSQPALTRSIQAAESELGLMLFDRRGHDIVPTPAGEFVIERARELLFNNRCLERDLQLYRTHGLGDTAFGLGPSPAAGFAVPLLASLRREFPGINLRVEISNWELLVKRL